MDVTYNVNKQHKDLFTTIVKDSSGQTFIGNTTLIPLGKHWVFGLIYKYFFPRIYGDVTILRNRLTLTDNDEAMWGPLENAIKFSKCWGNTVHMLCMFHALSIPFHESIYKLLPHCGTGKSKKLTPAGKCYGVFQ